MVRMAPVFRHEISRKKINVCATATTGLDFDPEKVFDRGIRSMAEDATCLVEGPKLRFESSGQLGCHCTVRSEIKGGDLLLHDPICHGIDIIANDVTSQPICLE
jgi:hypothetical protein